MAAAAKAAAVAAADGAVDKIVEEEEEGEYAEGPLLFVRLPVFNPARAASMPAGYTGHRKTKCQNIRQKRITATTTIKSKKHCEQ